MKSGFWTVDGRETGLGSINRLKNPSPAGR
jgi:hypothetical protein